MNIVTLIWVVSILFSFLIFFGLYNYGYLLGVHWFTVGFVAASAIFQFAFVDWPVMVAQLLPAIVACIGTLVTFIREHKNSSENGGRYEY